MAAKVSKLEEQFKLDAPREKQKDGASSSIFGGVAIYVNGYTGNAVKMGNVWSVCLSRLTTSLVSASKRAEERDLCNCLRGISEGRRAFCTLFLHF